MSKIGKKTKAALAAVLVLCLAGAVLPAARNAGNRQTEETEMPAAVSEVFLTTEDSQRHISVRGEARSRFLSDLIASVFFLPEAGYENEETVFLIYGENQVRQNRAGENEIGESD